MILLTSINADNAIRKLQKQGLQAVLTKPARSSQLLNTITQCLFDAQQESNGVVNLTANPEIQSESISQDLPRPRRSKPRDIERRLKPRKEGPNGSSLDVLIAEDNETNQIYIKYLMEQLGLSFKIVPNGWAAVDYWRSESPALILMDVSMPEMNGYEATAAIRKDERSFGKPRTPIIALTAHTLKGDEEKCIAAGMDDFVSKPVSIIGLKSKMALWADLEFDQTG